MARTQPKPINNRLRMKELVEATGLPKSTILFYVDNGLLPEPQKTSPNMAWYDRSCVERIAFIRRIQKTHHLPLQKIKTLLERRDRGEDVDPLLALGQAVFGDDRGPLLAPDKFRQATGLTPDQVDGLLEAKLLLPMQDGGFDQQDVVMGQIYAQGMSNGMTPNDWDYYPRLGKEIVDEEMRLRDRVTGHLPLAEDAAMTVHMVRAARATRSYVIDRLFQLRVAAAKDPKDREALL